MEPFPVQTVKLREKQANQATEKKAHANALLRV